MKFLTTIKVGLAVVLSTGLSADVLGTSPREFTIHPDCKPVPLASSTWDVSFCKRPANDDHYPTEIRFRREGKPVFSTVHWSDPTGGYVEGTVLAASSQFVVLELPGDGANQVLGFDLKKKAMVFNTGEIVGMSNCSVHAPTGDDDMCRVLLTCPIGDDDDPSQNYNAQLSEFLCP